MEEVYRGHCLEVAGDNGAVVLAPDLCIVEGVNGYFFASGYNFRYSGSCGARISTYKGKER